MIDYMSEDFSNIFLNSSLKVSVAESLTCGGIQKLFSVKSGASRYFEGGVTAYSLEQKVNILGVSREEAENTNCVSEGIAKQMALGVKKLFNADVSVSTTGYAEPDDSMKIIIPNVYISVCVMSDLFVKHIEMPNMTRSQAQDHASNAAIKYMIECIDTKIKI